MDYIELLRAHPGWFLLWIGLLGLAVGSFLNVVIHRLPQMLERGWKAECREYLGLEGDASDSEPLSLSKPRSRCPACGHAISALRNIPVISYLLLHGRCANCDTAIGARYPLVELTTAVLSLAVAWHFGVTWQTLAGLIFTWVLVALAMIDLDTQLLPDQITLPFLWLGLFFNLFGVFTDLQSAVIGAIAGYLVLWVVFQLFRLLTGKEGMGFGDFKLLALFGAWFGWQMLPQIILIASVVGAVSGLGLILLRRHEQGKPIPFGPYLAVAGWIALLWGQQINQAYLRLSGL